MLARNAQLLRDGTYVKPRNEKHSYGSMVTVRALMAEITGWDLMKAVAVAYHYTTFRKQFQQAGNQQETTVFDYASVRYRLLPLLAKTTALIVVGRNIKRAYDEYTSEVLETNDFSRLEDFHLQTVGAKVYATEITGHGIEICRIACGGHGYSALSGFGRMYGNAINAVTYEGDNYVVGMQLPRAILKHYRNRSEASLPTLSYLSILRHDLGQNQAKPPPIKLSRDWSSKDTQKWALQVRLSNLVRLYIEDTNASRDTSYSSHALTMAHCDLVYWNGLQDVVEGLEQKQESYAKSMRSLATVFSLSVLQDPHHPSQAQALPLSLDHQSLLREAYRDALADLAVNHVATIIDAYGLTEYEMDSALAKSDQTPYEALLDGAKKSEMSGAGMSHLWHMMVDTRNTWAKLQQEKQNKGLAPAAKL
jgi:acyl-CoA oxidase